MYLAFDTETTGLDNDCQVLTAHFVILDSDFDIIDECNLKIKYPYYKVYTKAMEINKIDLFTHEKQALDLSDSCQKLKMFLDKHKSYQKYIPMGHNVNFDIKKMSSEIFLSKKFDLFEYIHPFHTLDTMSIAHYYKSIGKLHLKQSLSLTNLCNFYNITHTGQLHDAETDIHLTIKLFKQFKSNEASFALELDAANNLLSMKYQQPTQSCKITKPVIKSDYNLRKR